MQYEYTPRRSPSLATQQTVSRVQKKGQVTIPGEIRAKLGLKEGDRITFVMTDDGILMSPQEVGAMKALDSIGELLTEETISLDELIASGRNIRGEIIKEKYGFSEGQ